MNLLNGIEAVPMEIEPFYEGLIFKWDDGKAYHLDISEDYISSYVLTAGSPSRIKLVSEFLEEPKVYEAPRGFTIVKGYYREILVSGFSSGIGPSSMAITLSEYLEMLLSKSNLGYVIRIGTAGPIQDYIDRWSIVIADSVVRDESTSARVIYPEYPAKMDPIIYLSLLDSAYSHGYTLDKNLFIGAVQSKDDLYYYEGFHNSPLKSSNRSRFQALKEMGVLATEMEASILPIIRDYFKYRYRKMGRSIGLYVGAILLILKGRFNKEELLGHEEILVKISLNALYTIDQFIKGRKSLDNILRWVSSGY